MSTQFFMRAFLCTAAPFVCSQNIALSQNVACDSAEHSISPQILNEVVVKAAPVISKIDRKIIRPDKEMLQTSADGMDLLRRLHLPRIAVNPTTNSITLAGGGEIVLCINGVESNAAQIASISPLDIIRVEYHDNPGIRFANAAVVIDYITTRHDNGGNLLFDTFGAFAKGRWASIDHISGQYNTGRSVWTANAGYMGQHKDKWVRDYDEQWHYPGETLTRHEDGLPVTVSQAGLESRINYNYLHPSGNVLNVRLGFDMTDVPALEEGDRRAILYTSNAELPVLVSEHSEEKSVSPNAGLYYKHRLSDTENIMIDVQGVYMRSHMLHEYSEDYEAQTDKVTGSKHSARVFGMYENHKDSRVWSVALSANGSAIANTYHMPEPVKLHIRQADAGLAGEYSNRFGNWNVMGNVKVDYRHMTFSTGNINRVLLSPALSVSYRPWNFCFMRFSSSIEHKMPGAAQVSDVVQLIQPGMVRTGNPELKPFRVLNQAFDILFETPNISLNPRIEYINEHNPIMESILFNDGQFVRTYLNQRSFQRLALGGTVSLSAWKKRVSVSVEPCLMRYFSHGVDYRHCHNIFRLGLSVDFNYKNWLAYANIMSGPTNNMYGEEIIEEKDMNQILVGYKRGIWSLHLGVFNAFMNNYWMKTENLSALAPYKSMAHSLRSNSYAAVKFNLSLDFGRGRREVEMRDNDLDNDSGILTGTK